MPGLRWQYHTFTPDLVFVTTTTIGPVVVNVSVVTPTKTLAYTLTPVVVDVLIVAPTIQIVFSDANEVWVETWEQQDP